MDLTVSDADIEVLASRLQVVMDDAYKQGQQAERERIKDILNDHVGYEVCELLEKIDDVS